MDDDSYVDLDRLEGLFGYAKYREADYLGAICHRGPRVKRDPTHKNYESPDVHPGDYYNVYADGIGYAVSRRAATSCLVQKIPDLRYYSNEDVATGILAEGCNISCITVPELLSHGTASPNAILARHVAMEEIFRELHAKTCSKTPTSVSCQGNIPIQTSSGCLEEVISSGTNASCYDDLGSKDEPFVIEPPRWFINVMKKELIHSWDEMEVVQSSHQNLTFVRDPLNDTTCVVSNKHLVTMCDSYRPLYYEKMAHYPARFLQSVRRVLFVGGDDSMLLHEILKYSSLERVVGLGLDQALTRYSFKHMGAKPHFDNVKVERWYGVLARTLAILPSSYYGSFDMVLVEASDRVMSLPVTTQLDTLEVLSLLLSPEGIMVKSGAFIDGFSKVFRYSLQLHLPGFPVVGPHSLVLGSNRFDFLNAKMKDHNLGTLLTKSLSSDEVPYKYWHDFRHNTTSRQLCGNVRIGAKATPLNGVLMIVELEGVEGSLRSPGAVLTAVANSLTSMGFHIVRQVAATSTRKPLVAIILQEGYVVLRTWSGRKYASAAIDIHLWSSLDKHDEARKSVVECIGGQRGTFSSYRVVAGGMSGARGWRANNRQLGPRVMHCMDWSKISHPNDVMMGTSDTAVMEEIVGGLVAGEDTVLVLCGERPKSCITLEILEHIGKASRVLPLWSCPDLETGDMNERFKWYHMKSCERELARTLMDASDGRLQAMIIDPSASFAMGKIAYEIFKMNSYRLLNTTTILSFALQDAGKLWRRNLMERFRTEIIVDDPNFGAQVLFNSTESTIVVDISATGGENLVEGVVDLTSRIEAKTSVAAEIRMINGGKYLIEADRTPECEFNPDDYDQKPSYNQWLSQSPMAYQAVFQLRKRGGASFALSFEVLQKATEAANRQIRSREFGNVELRIAVRVGGGSVMLAVWSGGSFSLLWDGNSQLNLNWFSYEESYDLPYSFLDGFQSQFPDKAWNVFLVDEQPRGKGHIVNFVRDLDEPINEKWAKFLKDQLEYVHITKVGGTAIEEASFEQEGVVWGHFHYLVHGNWTSGRIVKPLSIQVPYEGEPWHTPPHWMSPNPLRGPHTFAVVRNPYTRYVSEYFCEWYPGNKTENPMVDEASVMNKWIQTFIRRNRDEKQNGHMLPQHYYIYDEKTGQRLVDHVLKYEVNLPKSFARLVSTYGLSITLAEKKASSRKTSILNLTSETIQLINEYASKDFELLNYTKVSSANEFTDIDGSVSRSAPLRAAQEKSPEDTPSDLMNELLLNVPFYVYDDLGLPDDVTLDGKPFVIEDIDPQNPIHSVAPLLSKHADDVFLIRAAMKHPMRTHDPTEAKLFVIPTPFNMIMDRLRFGGELCVKEHCNAALIRHVDESLSKSTWFKKNQGQDHVAVLSHWRWHRSEFWRKHFREWKPTHIQQCNVIDFEGQYRAAQKDRAVFPSYYVGRRCASSGDDDKLHDFAMITTLKRKDAPIEFEDRMNICKWIQNETSHAMPACGEGSQCPALAQAKFGFHAIGDTYGSNRPMDTILSGTVPIFTREGQYDILPEWIDWDKISYFADVSNKPLFMQQIQDFVDDKETYNVKRLNVELNRDLFDYNTLVPFDTYMYMFLHKVHPELRRTNVKTRFNALRLPQT